MRDWIARLIRRKPGKQSRILSPENEIRLEGPRYVDRGTQTEGLEDIGECGTTSSGMLGKAVGAESRSIHARGRAEEEDSASTSDGSVVSVAELTTASTKATSVEQAVLDPKQQHRIASRRAYTAALARLQEAKTRFEQRDNVRMLEREHSEETDSEFDVRWVSRVGELTQQLIEAESVFIKTRADAQEAGVQVPDDEETSGFVGPPDEGYRESQDAYQSAQIPESQVLRWLNSIPNDGGPDYRSPVEVDQWKAEEVDMWDSITVVAIGPRRRDIDHWQRACSHDNAAAGVAL